MTEKQLTVRAKLGKVHDLLMEAESHIAAVLPKHLTPERMLRVTQTCIRRTPKLLDADLRSLVAAVVEASELGWDLGRQAFLIPFFDKKAKPPRLMVQLIPHYSGLEDLAFRSGKVGAITAVVVHEKDQYTYTEGITPTLEHCPTPDAEKGEVVAAYAVAAMTTTDYKPHVWLWRAEIDKIRNAAPSPDSPAWRNHYPEMAKKTAIKRLCKVLPVSIVQRAIDLQERAERGESQRFRLDFGATDLIDVASETIEPPTESEPPAEVDEAQESTNLCEVLHSRLKRANKDGIVRIETEATDRKADGGLHPEDCDTVIAACLARRQELAAAD